MTNCAETGVTKTACWAKRKLESKVLIPKLQDINIVIFLEKNLFAMWLEEVFVLIVILLKTLIGARCCNLLKPFKLIKFLVN